MWILLLMLLGAVTDEGVSSFFYKIKVSINSCWFKITYIGDFGEKKTKRNSTPNDCCRQWIPFWNKFGFNFLCFYSICYVNMFCIFILVCFGIFFRGTSVLRLGRTSNLRKCNLKINTDLFTYSVHVQEFNIQLSKYRLSNRYNNFSFQLGSCFFWICSGFAFFVLHCVKVGWGFRTFEHLLSVLEGVSLIVSIFSSFM